MSRRSSISLNDVWHHLLEVINVPAAHPGCHGTSESTSNILLLHCQLPLECLETSTTAEKEMRNAIDEVCRKTKITRSENELPA